MTGNPTVERDSLPDPLNASERRALRARIEDEIKAHLDATRTPVGLLDGVDGSVTRGLQVSRSGSWICHSDSRTSPCERVH